jgi:hypothetical protein
MLAAGDAAPDSRRAEYGPVSRYARSGRGLEVCEEYRPQQRTVLRESSLVSTCHGVRM